MNRLKSRLLAFGLVVPVVIVQTAASVVAYESVKGPLRRLGGALEDDPMPVGGWRMGLGITRPFGVGPSVAYLMPLSPVSAKIGCQWGWVSDSGVSAFGPVAGRLYGAAVYYLAPQSGQLAGPYVETGGGVVRAPGEAAGNWPIWPHIGFGHAGRLSETLAWDVNFSVSGNGLICLEAGLLSGRVNTL